MVLVVVCWEFWHRCGLAMSTGSVVILEYCLCLFLLVKMADHRDVSSEEAGTNSTCRSRSEQPLKSPTRRVRQLQADCDLLGGAITACCQLLQSAKAWAESSLNVVFFFGSRVQSMVMVKGQSGKGKRKWQK